MTSIRAFFGVFGFRDYTDWRVVDIDLNVIEIDCRWCIGESRPTMNCSACKNTRKMWING